MNKTKIIATIGPSTNQPHIIRNMIKKGMNVARLNMAHSSSNKSVENIVNLIREESNKLNQFVAIIMDIAGPKVRVDFSNNKNQDLKIIKNKIYTLGYLKSYDIQINMDINFGPIKDKQAFVKIDDGKIVFKILSTSKKALKIKALNSGLINPNKGVNFPGISLNVPTLTSKDIKDIKLGIKLKIDWFALSFVRSHKDLNEFKKIYNRNTDIPVIAKIEKPEAIERLDKIIKCFDGVLIARGDLGVEMPLSELPIIQKNIIKQCRLEKKPVIIATQILESMIKISSPTRAEINDVANAVYEEVDAVMLSGETAVGKFPLECISIMKKTILNVEKENNNQVFKIENEYKEHNPRYAIGEAVKSIIKNLKANAVVVMTESGSTSRIVSHFRPRANIFSLSPHLEICYRNSLLWGVVSIQTEEYLSTDEMLVNAEKLLLDSKYIRIGQIFVMTAGIPVGVSGSTNMLKIHKIID
ncbi:MAG: pyruvate kinase [Candidatus Marinimicrobia bacterium]|nr:pyruvate kinase [Candidatus Neomarinimicrobiota bacterium]